ncbi:MAG: GDSL-type esterase/lipase family protein [Chloroflexota bacterium]|nr:GDSL-type esterase/lipase family protein [Chloroflexota bacterium]
MKIALLGDSLTWGGYGGNYVEALRPLLPQHELINAGEGGNTVLNLLRRLDRVLESQPDGVFVMIGGNDAISFCQPGTRSYYRNAQKIDGGIVTIDQFEAGYRDLLTRLQLAQIVTWIGLTPIEYNPLVVETMQQYNARAASAARTFGVPTLDLLAALNPPTIPARSDLDINYILTIGSRAKRGWNDYAGERARGGFSYSFDGLHLTPEGAGRVAQLISAFIDS